MSNHFRDTTLGMWPNTGPIIFEFHPSGDFREVSTELAIDLKGDWKSEGKLRVVVTRSDGTNWHFEISPDGKSISRKERADGVKWTRLK